MKIWLPILILFISVISLCVWDTANTNQIFKTIEEKSDYIYTNLKTKNITDEKIQTEILELNNYWTEKMDTLCISISRKDLQPVSDYLQYLCSSITNENQEDAITYSRLLNYNIIGLKEMSGINLINLL